MKEQCSKPPTGYFKESYLSLHSSQIILSLVTGLGVLILPAEQDKSATGDVVTLNVLFEFFGPQPLYSYSSENLS